MSTLNQVIFNESLSRVLDEGHEYYAYADWLAVLMLHMGLVA